MILTVPGTDDLLGRTRRDPSPRGSARLDRHSHDHALSAEPAAFLPRLSTPRATYRALLYGIGLPPPATTCRKGKELIRRLRAGRCEWCEQRADVQVRGSWRRGVPPKLGPRGCCGWSRAGVAGDRCAARAPGRRCDPVPGWRMMAVISSREQRGRGNCGERAAGAAVREDDAGVLPVTSCRSWRFVPGYKSGAGGDLAGWVLSLRARRSDSAFPAPSPGQPRSSRLRRKAGRR